MTNHETAKAAKRRVPSAERLDALEALAEDLEGQLADLYTKVSELAPGKVCEELTEALDLATKALSLVDVKACENAKHVDALQARVECLADTVSTLKDHVSDMANRLDDLYRSAV